MCKTFYLFPFLVFFVYDGISQKTTPPEQIQELFVFLDCNARNCDFDHFRREVKWVNWVRDREDGDLHLLITDENTGGGGRQYKLDFIGRKNFEGFQKSNHYTSDPNDTDTEVRENLANAIALGLVQFVENSAPAIASRLRVTYDEPDIGEEIMTSQEYDPWNLWVYRIGADASFDSESSEKAYSLEGSVSASRVSEDFKITISARGEYEREEFEDLDEGETFISTSEDYRGDISAVWSLNPKWSFGAITSVNRSTFVNRDLAWFIGPALEYNIFPYSESTRRSITFRYTAELAMFDYEKITVEGKTSEWLPRHTFLVGAALQQPWGEIFGSIEGIQYLHDLSTHRINTFVNLEYRLFRGFSIDLNMSFSRIKDQFFLTAEGLTPEEILLRRRQRETDHRFDFGIGFSYRFGSKYSNIVNPRMSRGRRGFRG